MNKRRLGAILLGSIPFVAICFSVPLWDRVYPIVFGIPFNLFWLMTWLVLTPLCMWGIYRIRLLPPSGNSRREREGRAP